MLTKLDYRVLPELLQEAQQLVLLTDLKSTINQPTGRFFYDPWEIKPEYKNTVWEEILNSLPLDIGEARIIKLLSKQCYQSHSDIDDRYHLNISGSDSFLVDLDSRSLDEIVHDGHWYAMDAGPRHSAANFGQVPRIQLVVRKLLQLNELRNPVKIKLAATRLDNDDARFFFDQTVSVWLNRANKNKLISDFNYNTADCVSLTIERFAIDDLKSILYPEFTLEILD
jgi:hypothetical protein